MRGLSPTPLASRLLALLLGATMALGATEVAFRVHPPGLLRRAGSEPPWARALADEVDRSVLVPDPELGYRPLPGGRDYGEHGALRNRHPAGAPRGRRVLFLGDSVTRRGALLRALEPSAGADVELWNAGVEGYSTVQEVGYYRRWLAGIGADHVVLTFHPNDFETTPLSFCDGEGRMHLYWSRLPLAELDPWLLRHSRVYRFLIGWRLWRQGAADVPAQVEAELVLALEELAALTAERGARLSVLVLPRLEPRACWSALAAERHARILGHLERLGIEHWDLAPALARPEAAQGLRETPGDVHHPGAGFAAAAAGLLEESGFAL